MFKNKSAVLLTFDTAVVLSDPMQTREVQFLTVWRKSTQLDVSIAAIVSRLVQPSHVRSRKVTFAILTNGKDVSLEQPSHANPAAPVADEKSRAGKDVNSAQPRHILTRFSRDEVSIAGKDVNFEQSCHVPPPKTPFVALDVLINGKVVNSEQPDQAVFIVVTNDVLINGKDVSPIQPNHALSIFVAADITSNGKDVSPEHPLHVPEKFSPADVLSVGNDAAGELVPNPLQFVHVLVKVVTNVVSIVGNSVSPVQKFHAP